MEREKYAVVYACDDGYAYLAGVSLISLFNSNNINSDVSVYVLSDGISNDNQEKFNEISKKYGFELNIIDVTTLLASIRNDGADSYWVSYSAYARIYIDDILPKDINRIVYIDCDTLVVGDISYLLNIDMGECGVGMAYDCMHTRVKKTLGIDINKPYFNSGVLVINREMWNKYHYKEKINNELRCKNVKYLFGDQDLLNRAFNQDDIFILPLEYNVLSQDLFFNYKGYLLVYDLNNNIWYSKDAFESGLSNVRIYHFCGYSHLRPWFTDSKHPAAKRWRNHLQNSPWKQVALNIRKWEIHYKIQYYSCKLLPHCFSNLIGFLMQRIFIELYY